MSPTIYPELWSSFPTSPYLASDRHLYEYATYRDLGGSWNGAGKGSVWWIGDKGGQCSREARSLFVELRVAALWHPKEEDDHGSEKRD